MFPEIVELPWIHVTIHSYGTLIVLAFLLGSWWAKRTAVRRLGVDGERVFNVCFILLFIGIFGARMVHAFGHYAEFTAKPMSFLAIWEGGLVLYGGVVAALLFLAWYLPSRPELKGFALLDVLARATSLALVLGWFASLMAGDDYGKPTEAAFGLPAALFKDNTNAVKSVQHILGNAATTKLHASQIYGSLFALGVFLLLGLVSRRAKVSGRVAAVFLMVHSLGTAVLEIFRGDGKLQGERPYLIGSTANDLPAILSWGQFLAIPVFFTGVAIWLIRRPERDTVPMSAPTR